MCCGESVVQIGISNGPSVAVRALVVDEALFGYDLLLGLSEISSARKSDVCCYYPRQA